MNRILFLAVLLLPCVARAANPAFTQFNTNHFTTNGYVISARGFLTNSSVATQVTNIVNAALANPNMVWFATNGSASGDGSYNKPIDGPSNAVRYARSTYGHNWTVRGRAGRYTVFGSPSTGTHITNEAAIIIHGATNSALILDDGCTIYSTNWASMIDLVGVDGFVISGGTLEGVKMGTNSSSATAGFVDIRNNSRNVVVQNQRHIRAPNHGVGPINSLTPVTNIVIRNLEQENIGMTSGFPTLVYDGSGIVTWGENWVVSNIKQHRALRGVEQYGEGRNIEINGLFQTKIQQYGVCFIGDGGIGISNYVVRNWSFADAEFVGLEITAFLNQAVDTKRVTIESYDIDAANTRYGIASSGSAVAGVDTVDWKIGPGNIHNQLAGDYAAIVVGSPGSGINSNITVIGNKISDVYGQAMSFSAQDSLIVDNIIDGAGVDGSVVINIYNLQGKEQRMKVLNNYIRGHPLSAAGIKLNSFGAPATNNQVHGNYIYSWAAQPIIDENLRGANYTTWNYTTNQAFHGTNASPFQTVFNSNVGIGTNNPPYPLTVYNTTPSGPTLVLYHTPGSGGDAIRIFNGAGAQNVTIGIAGDISSGGGGFIRTLTVTNEGYFLNGPVAIGTNAAITSLEIFSSDPEGAFKITSPHGPSLLFVNTNGNVGIGTNAPTARLDIIQQLAASAMIIGYDTNGQQRFQLSTLPSAPYYFAIYAGNATRTVANYILAAEGTNDTSINAPGASGVINNAIAGTAETRLNSTTLFPVADQGNRLGDATHRWARLDVGTEGITNAGPLNLINGPLKVGNNGGAITNILIGSASLDYGGGGINEDLTITVTGAAVGDVATWSVPAAITATANFSAWVSAANTVTVRATENSGATLGDLAAGTFTVIVFKKQ